MKGPLYGFRATGVTVDTHLSSFFGGPRTSLPSFSARRFTAADTTAIAPGSFGLYSPTPGASLYLRPGYMCVSSTWPSAPSSRGVADLNDEEVPRDGSLRIFSADLKSERASYAPGPGTSEGSSPSSAFDGSPPRSEAREARGELGVQARSVVGPAAA